MPKPKKTKVLDLDAQGTFRVATTVHGATRDAVLNGIPTVEITDEYIRTGCMRLTHSALDKLHTLSLNKRFTNGSPKFYQRGNYGE